MICKLTDSQKNLSTMSSEIKSLSLMYFSVFFVFLFFFFVFFLRLTTVKTVQASEDLLPKFSLTSPGVGRKEKLGTRLPYKSLELSWYSTSPFISNTLG